MTMTTGPQSRHMLFVERTTAALAVVVMAGAFVAASRATATAVAVGAGLMTLNAWALRRISERVQLGSGRTWWIFPGTNFDSSPGFGALVGLVFGIIGGFACRASRAKGGDVAIVPPPRFNLRNLFEMLTAAVLSVASGVMCEKN